MLIDIKLQIGKNLVKSLAMIVIRVLIWVGHLVGVVSRHLSLVILHFNIGYNLGFVSYFDGIHVLLIAFVDDLDQVSRVRIKAFLVLKI